MSYTQVFYDSFERVLGEQAGISDSGLAFFDHFYNAFMATSDEVKKAFKNTDMPQQKKMLRKSLLYCVTFTLSEEGTEFMEGIAHIHSKDKLGVDPKLYDVWLECLIETVSKFDPLFSQTVDLGWRIALSPGITFMKYRYDKY